MSQAMLVVLLLKWAGEVNAPWSDLLLMLLVVWLVQGGMIAFADRHAPDWRLHHYFGREHGKRVAKLLRRVSP